MSYDDFTLNYIFGRTGGLCHLCGGGVCFGHYGRHEKTTGWEVDHSNPRANGGTSRLSNLLPAHTSCNRRKQDRSTRSVRAENGLTRIPTRDDTATESAGDTAIGVIGFAALVGLGALIFHAVTSTCEPAPTPQPIDEDAFMDLSEPWKIVAWVNEMGCAEGELRTAVQQVGTRVSDVRRYLLLGY